MNQNERALPYVLVKEKRVLDPTEIPISKLVTLTNKDDLMDFFRLEGYCNLEKRLKDENGTFKITDMKKYLLNHNEILEGFRRSPVISRVYDKYVEKTRKLNS